ncbi:T9SS type B sorting domain-containing protein [Parapedobacter soli]|uniref:T9SS type B sorting domain-containing protein n=1 Tax=Parapedobacter soli TaxID=416955 RepID=UPI0021C9068B|nr:gliding motility-associated C-terminal domain-containing protein [Parapedobacter soli]
MKLKNRLPFSARRLGMLAGAILWAAAAHGQLTVQDDGIKALPGLWFSYERLALLPASGAPLVMRGKTLAFRPSPVSIGTGNSLPRVYRLSGPVAFTGRVRVRYHTAELGQHDEATLLLFAQATDDEPFKPIMGSTSHTGSDRYVEADLEDRSFVALTIADPTALGYALTPQRPTASEITDGGFALAWPEVIGAESYQLDVSQSVDFSTFMDGYESRTVANTAAVATGLSPGTDYHFRIRLVDAGGATLQSPGGSAQTLTAVASITRSAGSPTNAEQLTYTVTFASPVAGVDAADFALTTSGSATATIGVPTGIGSVWTVPVSAVAGQGALRLDFVDTAGIRPHAVRTFASGEAYVIDRVPPVAKAKDIRVTLGTSGTVTITPQQVDDGSADAGGAVTLSLDKTVFNRNETGRRTVTLTVTDAVGNTAATTATVDVGRDVAAAADLADVATTYGIPAAQLPLPEQVGVVYTDGTSANAAITWDRSTFGDGVGTYVLSGTIIPAEHTTNTQAVKATVRVVVAQATQIITFIPPGELRRDAGSISLQVGSSSGLPVSLSVDDEQVATVSSTTLNVLRLGTVRITARQAGDANHLAAAPVTITVTVVDPTEEFSIRVHPAVSPNADGINDFLMIEGIRDYPENKVTIFNRNGTLIYEATGYDNGTTKAFRGISTGGLTVPMGTYFYLVEINDNGQWKHKKGYFVLK